MNAAYLQSMHRSSARFATYGGRDESYMLLLELGMQEPTMQACIKIVQSTCLAQGMEVEIKGKKSTNTFQSFVTRYYLPFAEEAIRHFYILGFVPWRLRKLSSGDCVPEVIPLGLFTWTIDSSPNRISTNSKRRSQSLLQTHDQLASERAFQMQKAYFSKKEGDKKMGEDVSEEERLSKRQKPSDGERQQAPASFHRQKQAMDRFSKHMYNGGNPADNEESKLLRYQIAFTENCGLMEEEVEIYEFVPPSNNVTRTSVLYGSVPSPMAHILVDYRNMRHAQIMQSYAECYNLQAKFICSYKPSTGPFNKTGDQPSARAEESEYWIQTEGQNPHVGGAAVLPRPAMFPASIQDNAVARDQITETLVQGKQTEHTPVVYTLPKNTTLETQQKLESIVNVPQMQIKFAKDVCSLIGIPFEMVSGGYDEMKSGEKRRTASNNKIFITNMMSVCRHLKQLMIDVYLATFGGSAESVNVVIRATPRIEISSIEEICQLLDSGVVSQQNAMDLSNMIFGVDLKQGAGKDAGASIFAKQFVTPKNKAGLIAAEAQKTRALHPPPSKSS